MSTNYNISFVVLYYKAYADTIDCISSVMQLDQKRCSINVVLVDNFSNDGSFEKLEAMYADNSAVHCIRTGDNLGYARGNNAGIKYAKDELGADFAIVLNTDAVIEQADFCDKLCEIFEREQFYVLGPRVLGYYDNLSQSPRKYSDDDKVFSQLVNDYVHLFAWKTNLIKAIRKVRPQPKIDRALPEGDAKYKCVCHGCCLVFSPLHLKRWDKGFYDKTFLYREELILFYILHKLGCTTMFCDELTVYHKGGTSVDAELGNSGTAAAERQKRIRTYKTRIPSIKQEMKVMKMKTDRLEELLK
ncbi:MAG: glycosyltransferase family 2 protein [Clostridia bacterium]|nr:glycosyltransferase family 2 protein [Clostridia bacterium]